MITTKFKLTFSEENHTYKWEFKKSSKYVLAYRDLIKNVWKIYSVGEKLSHLPSERWFAQTEKSFLLRVNQIWQKKHKRTFIRNRSKIKPVDFNRKKK